MWGDGISQNVVWYVVKGCCARVGLQHIAPHDLRRTCAKLCHTNGGEIEQISSCSDTLRFRSRNPTLAASKIWGNQ
jgi:integrase